MIKKAIPERITDFPALIGFGIAFLLLFSIKKSVS